MSEPVRWTQAELDAHMKKFHPGKLPEACHSPAKPTAKTILPRARKMNATETAWSQATRPPRHQVAMGGNHTATGERLPVHAGLQRLS